MVSQILTRDDLRTAAPSLFARYPYEAMRPRYKFVRTDGVLDIMDHLGFKPVVAVRG